MAISNSILLYLKNILKRHMCVYFYLLVFFFINVSSSIALGSSLKEAREHIKKNDFVSANKIFIELSQKGNAEAQHELAISFILGEGLKKDIIKGYKILLISADNGFILSQIKICDAYVKGKKSVVEHPFKKNYSKAMKYCIPSAKRNAFLSQTNLFKIYSNKNEKNNNLKEAYFWAQKAVYNTTDSDKLPALHDAMTYELGLMYERGLGVNKDFTKAYALYKKANDKGLPSAQFALGNIYELGFGDIKINLKKAYNYFKMSAQQKFIPSFVNLGLMYKNGKYVKKDKMKANMWMSLASINGDDYGDKNLSKWKQNNILQLLNEDIPKLKKMIKQCSNSNYLRCYYQ